MRVLSDLVLCAENESVCGRGEQSGLLPRKLRLTTRLGWVLGTGKKYSQRSHGIRAFIAFLYRVVVAPVGFVRRLIVGFDPGTANSSEEVWEEN